MFFHFILKDQKCVNILAKKKKTLEIVWWFFNIKNINSMCRKGLTNVNISRKKFKIFKKIISFSSPLISFKFIIYVLIFSIYYKNYYYFSYEVTKKNKKSTQINKFYVYAVFYLKRLKRYISIPTILYI